MGKFEVQQAGVGLLIVGDARVSYRAATHADARWATWRWAPAGASTHPLDRNAAMVADVAEVAKRRHLTRAPALDEIRELLARACNAVVDG